MVNGSQRRGMAYIMRRTTSRAASGLGARRRSRESATCPVTVIDRALVVRLERKPSDHAVDGWRDRDRRAIEDLQRRVER